MKRERRVSYLCSSLSIVFIQVVHQIDLNTYPMMREVMVELTGAKTVPQIFFKEVFSSFPPFSSLLSPPFSLLEPW